MNNLSAPMTFGFGYAADANTTLSVLDVVFSPTDLGGVTRRKAARSEGGVRIAASWVLNSPEPTQIIAHTTLRNTSGRTIQGSLRFSVINPKNRQVLARVEAPLELAANRMSSVSSMISIPEATIVTCPRELLALSA